jgi:hypothetical protein
MMLTPGESTYPLRISCQNSSAEENRWMRACDKKGLVAGMVDWHGQMILCDIFFQRHQDQSLTEGAVLENLKYGPYARPVFEVLHSGWAATILHEAMHTVYVMGGHKFANVEDYINSGSPESRELRELYVKLTSRNVHQLNIEKASVPGADDVTYGYNGCVRLARAAEHMCLEPTRGAKATARLEEVPLKNADTWALLAAAAWYSKE